MDLLAVQGTLKSLLQHHSSKASILWHSAFFMVQLSHPYMTTGKTIALTIWTFVIKLFVVLTGHSMFLLAKYTKPTLDGPCSQLLQSLLVSHNPAHIFVSRFSRELSSVSPSEGVPCFLMRPGLSLGNTALTGSLYHCFVSRFDFTFSWRPVILVFLSWQ